MFFALEWARPQFSVSGIAHLLERRRHVRAAPRARNHIRGARRAANGVLAQQNVVVAVIAIVEKGAGIVLVPPCTLNCLGELLDLVLRKRQQMQVPLLHSQKRLDVHAVAGEERQSVL